MGEQSLSKIRLLAGESFELVRMGLREVFKNHPKITLVDDTDCIDDLLTLALQHKPDVVLVDLHLNNGNCAEHIAKLLSDCGKHNLALTQLQKITFIAIITSS